MPDNHNAVLPMFSPMARTPDKKYHTIVADPPWDYREHRGDGPKGAGAQYPCMKAEEILTLPVGGWAEDNANLFLWVTNAFFVQGHNIAIWTFSAGRSASVGTPSATSPSTSVRRTPRTSTPERTRDRSPYGVQPLGEGRVRRGPTVLVGAESSPVRQASRVFGGPGNSWQHDSRGLTENPTAFEMLENYRLATESPTAPRSGTTSRMAAADERPKRRTPSQPPEGFCSSVVEGFVALRGASVTSSRTRRINHATKS